jgi:hypothetical protein
MGVLKDVPAASWKVELAFLARSRMELAVSTWVRTRDCLSMVGDKGSIGEK